MAFRIHRGIWQFQKPDGAYESKYKLNDSGQLVETDTEGNETGGMTASVSWTSVSGRPTALSGFTNDLGNYGGWLTTSGKAADSDKVDGYHASNLWRNDGGSWNPGANILLGQTANNQEWSFDITRNGYTGGYWHVWDSANSTMLKVDAVSGKVSAPYNFVGNLEGSATTLATARTLTIGNTGKTFNGGANVSWTLAEIGAQAAGSYAAASHTHDDRYYTESEVDSLLAGKQAAGSYAASNHNHTYNVNDNWLRENGDNANFQIYGNTRQVAFRTDGTTEYASGVGGYAFAWMYGGDAASNRRMLLASDGRLWSSYHGWMDDAFQPRGSYAATSHTHAISDVTGLQTALDGKQAAGTYLTSLPSHNHDDRYFTETESDNRFVRKDTTGQYLKPYNEYTSNLPNSSVPSSIVSQMGGGGLRVDFLSNPSFGSWAHAISFSGYNGYNMYQLAGHYKGSGGEGPDLYVRCEPNHAQNSWSSWEKLWHTGNDGSGSGLDADLLDGNHASAFYLATNPSGYITGSYLNDYTRGAYRVISDYGGNTTWYLRSNGQFIFATGHDWTASFRLSIDNGSGYGNNGSWAYFGQQDSNSTNGTWRGVRIRKYAGGNVDGDLSAGAFYIGDARKDLLWDTAYNWGNHAGLYAAASHTHSIANVTGLQGALDGKQAAGSYLTSLPAHTHDDRYYTESESDTRFATAAQGAKADSALQSLPAHTHDDRYYTESESLSLFARKDTNSAIGGNLVIGNGTYGNSTAYGNSGARLMFSGSNSDAQGNYYIGTNHEEYGGNYSKLDLRWHTGIRMGAQAGYGGIRFYDNEDFGSRIMSIGESDTNVRIDNNLWIGGAGGWITDLLAGKQASGSYAAASHTHTIANVTGLQAALDDKQAAGSYAASSHTHDYVPLAGGTMSGTLTLKNISGVSQTVPNSYGAYLHLGSWGDGRTAAGAVLVNTAYRADYATSLFDMNISRFTNDSGYITAYGAQGANGNFYIDDNYGNTVVGVYSSTRYQGVYAMGDAYKLAADGASTGSLYGIAWTHTNVGGESKSGLGHQALFMMNGRTYTAIGSGIWTDGTITTTSHGTSANWNTAYGWGNHASAGYLTSLPSHNHDGSYLPIDGKAADSNLLDGLDLHTGRNNEANKIVRTQANGYVEDRKSVV